MAPINDKTIYRSPELHSTPRVRGRRPGTHRPHQAPAQAPVTGFEYRACFGARVPFLLTNLDRDPVLDALYPIPIPLTNESDDQRFNHSDVERMTHRQLAREIRAVRMRLAVQGYRRPWVLGWLKDRLLRLRWALHHGI